jgi:hypothetical protein
MRVQRKNACSDERKVMNLLSKLVAVGAVAVSATAVGSVSAAGHSYDPNVARVANPANVCASIPGTIAFDAALLGMPAPDLSWFDFSDCVNMLARGAAVVEPVEEFGNPYEQCDALVGFGAFAYPATLHSGEGGEEDLFLPDLTVRNRKECGSALYAFHAIATTVFGE